MAANEQFIHTGGALFKIMDQDTGGVTVKVCPRYDINGGEVNGPEYDEMEGAVSTNLGWREINLLIRDLRTIRDRVFGKPE